MSRLTATITINEEACKGCSLCIPVCPVGVLALSERFNSKSIHPVELTGECVGCELCYLVCPDFVFEVFRGRPAGRTEALAAGGV
jgi:2-oxoglutarate ferredoxin oxidoreductase subunit delta